jgi:hypothetical protein
MPGRCASPEAQEVRAGWSCRRASGACCSVINYTTVWELGNSGRARRGPRSNWKNVIRDSNSYKLNVISDHIQFAVVRWDAFSSVQFLDFGAHLTARSRPRTFVLSAGDFIPPMSSRCHASATRPIVRHLANVKNTLALEAK